MSTASPSSRRLLLLTTLLMSVQMGLIVSGFMTALEMGITDGFLRIWMSRFATTFAVVLPVVLLLAPLSAKMAAWIDARLPGRLGSDQTVN